MALVRRIARPLLASIFVYAGWDAFKNPAGKAPAAEKLLGDAALQLPGINSTEQLVRADGALKVGAGVLLALGRFPRLSALALGASLIPTTVAGHRFWEISDPQQKRIQALQFAKNASILGGLILAAVDTEGKPSMGWRTRRAARRLAESASETVHAVGDRAHAVLDHH
jgi:uncharacterized membrane protein YphA (DoxX/SURF4 family)